MRCIECGHDQESHMINGSKNAVCQVGGVGGLTEEPCECPVNTFVPSRVWNEKRLLYERPRG